MAEKSVRGSRLYGTATDKFGEAVSEFSIFLRLERSLSPNTVAAYCNDVEKYFAFLKEPSEMPGSSPLVPLADPQEATAEYLKAFIEREYSAGISKRSQARELSSIRMYYKFKEVEENPCDRIDAPKLTRYLPSVLSVDEVISILESVDLTAEEGLRNRAILEMLYSCGLRVSELVNLKLSDLFFNDSFIRVVGKGNKQRIVPVCDAAIDAVNNYIPHRWGILQSAGPNGGKRKDSKGGESGQSTHDEYLFLNRRGGKLTREMVFLIVKDATEKAGIKKTVSPHTFRHSFATHLVENGADLRVVQEMLGHSSILTTEIYTHVSAKKWQGTILKFHPLNKGRN